MVFSFSKSLDLVPLTISGTHWECETVWTPGVTLSANLTWNEHIDSTNKKCNQHLYLLLHLRRARMPPTDLVTLYTVINRPVLEYATRVWHSSLLDCLSKNLQQVQRRALHTCFGDGSYNELLNAAGLPTLLHRRVMLCETFYTKMNMSEHKLHSSMETASYPGPSTYLTKFQYRTCGNPSLTLNFNTESVINPDPS